MRTVNNHPKWANRPLRLNKEQRENPILVITNFFDNFHLQEVRELLWNWTVEVLTTNNNIGSNAFERGNILFFYEQVEALIEAAMLIEEQEKKKRK